MKPPVFTYHRPATVAQAVAVAMRGIAVVSSPRCRTASHTTGTATAVAIRPPPRASPRVVQIALVSSATLNRLELGAV